MKGDYMKPGLHSDGQYRSRPLGKLCLSPCKGPGTWCTYTPALFKWVWIQRNMSRRDQDLTEPTWLRQPIGRKRERGGWGGRPSGQVESLEEGSTRSRKHTVDCRMTIQQMNYLCQSLAPPHQDLPPDHYHQPQVFHPCWCSFPPPSQPGRCSEPEMGVAWHTLCRSSPRRSWTDESCRMRQSLLRTCHQELTPGQGGVRGTNPHTQHTARKNIYFKVSLRGGCFNKRQTDLDHAVFNRVFWVWVGPAALAVQAREVLKSCRKSYLGSIANFQPDCKHSWHSPLWLEGACRLAQVWGHNHSGSCALCKAQPAKFWRCRNWKFGMYQGVALMAVVGAGETDSSRFERGVGRLRAGGACV